MTQYQEKTIKYYEECIKDFDCVKESKPSLIKKVNYLENLIESIKEREYFINKEDLLIFLLSGGEVLCDERKLLPGTSKTTIFYNRLSGKIEDITIIDNLKEIRSNTLMYSNNIEYLQYEYFYKGSL